MVSLTGDVAPGKKAVASGRGRHAQAAYTSSSAARRRWWSSTTRIWKRSSLASGTPATPTPGRTARPPRAVHRRDLVSTRGLALRALFGRGLDAIKIGRSLRWRGGGDGPAGLRGTTGRGSHGFLDRAKGGPRGVEFLAGGHTTGGGGWILRASLHARDPASPQDSEIVQREVFGPVVTVQRFGDDDEAIRWANDVPLRAGRFGVDQGRQAGRLSAARKLRFGTVWINDHITTRLRRCPRRLQGVGLRQGHERLRHRGLYRQSSTSWPGSAERPGVDASYQVR